MGYVEISSAELRMLPRLARAPVFDISEISFISWRASATWSRRSARRDCTTVAAATVSPLADAKHSGNTPPAAALIVANVVLLFVKIAWATLIRVGGSPLSGSNGGPTSVGRRLAMNA